MDSGNDRVMLRIHIYRVTLYRSLSVKHFWEPGILFLPLHKYVLFYVEVYCLRKCVKKRHECFCKVTTVAFLFSKLSEHLKNMTSVWLERVKCAEFLSHTVQRVWLLNIVRHCWFIIIFVYTCVTALVIPCCELILSWFVPLADSWQLTLLLPAPLSCRCTSSCHTVPPVQQHLLGGGDLLCGLLSNRHHDHHRDHPQDSGLLKEERLQQSAGCPQAGQKHSSAQTGNRK